MMARKDKRGFTLIELIAVIAVIGVLIGAVVPIAVSWVGAYNATLGVTTTLDKLRYATERIARELRDAQSGTLNMSTTSPSFTRIEYAAGVATTRQVTIGQGAGIVTLSYSTPSVSTAPVLTDQLGSLSFSYYDYTGNATATAANTCYVGIALTLVQGTQNYTQQTRVRLRNQNNACYPVI